MKKTLLGSSAAVVGVLGATAAAQAGVCPTAPVSTYTMAGFSCSVDNGAITFSNIKVTTSVSNGGSVLLTQFAPFQFGNEFGLTLTYTATATGPTSTADVTWSYDVAGAIEDAFLQLVASDTGSGVSAVTEVLLGKPPQPNPLQLFGSGSTMETFPLQTSLQVTKDQVNSTGQPPGFASASSLTNAFSVPAPVVGAGLPGLIAACGGLLALARRRRQKAAVA